MTLLPPRPPLESSPPAAVPAESRDDAPALPMTPAADLPLVNGVRHFTRFEDLPAFSELLSVEATEQNSPIQQSGVVSIGRGKSNDLLVLGLPGHLFFLVSSPQEFKSPAWFHTLSQCKRMGYRLEGFATASRDVFKMVYYDRAPQGSRQSVVAQARAEAQIVREIVAQSGPLEWFSARVLQALKLGASDMHFEVRHGVANLRMRIDGLVRMISSFPAGMVVDAVSAAYTVMAEERSRSNTAFNAGQVQAALIPLSIGEYEVSLRYQSHPAVGGFDVVLRLLKRAGKNSAPLSLERLGFTPWQNERLQESIASSWGGIFVAGVTGSGKTTTLNTLMTEMARDGSSKLVTIEDPVEYEIAGVTHMSIQREASDDSHNPFHAAMMAFLRMDPDVGLFGEIRDAVSGRMAQAAIQTGHKILATVHAASAMGVISRLSSESVGLKRDDLCHPEFISALLFQSLIPMNCQHCKRPATQVMTALELQPYTQAFGLNPQDIFCASEHGCPHCLRPGVDYSHSQRNGVRGVKVAAEVLCPDTTLLKLLTQGQEFEARRYWRSQRTSPFNSPDMLGKEAWGHALYDVSRGLIDPYYFEKTFGKANVLAKLTQETAA